MIGQVLLGIWLFPAILAVPLIIAGMMIDERTLFPFEEWYEPFIFIGLALVWPGLLGLIVYEYREERKKKLAEVQKIIDAHYESRWYE